MTKRLKKAVRKSDDDLVYEGTHALLYLNDTFDFLSRIKTGSINMIFADPPYFLSNGGISVASGKQVSVNKADWDIGYSTEQKHKFNRRWIRKCKRVLADDGTIWISGTFHNIYSVGLALEQEGFRILNNITWQKTNPPPNLACRSFTHSTETVLWARKENDTKHYYDYKLMKAMNNDKQMKDVWSGSLTPPREKQHGKHPTQKPEYLLERIIMSATQVGDVILDPFNGSGTTGVVSTRLERMYIGIDFVEDYLKISRERIQEVENDKT